MPFTLPSQHLYGTVMCLGDSLTYGARAEVCGFPESLAGCLNEKQSPVVWSTINRGISGQTTLEILRRTYEACKQLDSNSGANWMVLIVGTNDSKPTVRTPHDRWLALYRQILNWITRYQFPLVLGTLPTVDPRIMPYYDQGSVEWIELANEIIMEEFNSIKSKSNQRVEILNLNQHVNLEDIPDGVHFSQACNDSIAKLLSEIILQ